MINRILKRWVFFAIVIASSITLSAQSVNTQLRDLFKNLSPANNHQADALFDMSTHMTAEDFWQPISYKTTNVDNWATMYEEFYYMQYDTTDIDPADSVFSRVMRVHGDVVTIGILDRDYSLFVDSVFDSHDTIYFQQDSTTLELIDYPNRVAEPYRHNNVFTFSPLKGAVRTNHVTFRVDPNFIFNDKYNPYDKRSGNKLQMDFDDGIGWRDIDPNIISEWPITYTSGSKDRLLKARVLEGEKGTVLKYSQASFRVIPNANQVAPPDEFFPFLGLNVGVYQPCFDGAQEPEERKYIIYLSGIDMLEEVTVADMYESISGAGLADLRNHGYTFVVVDWQNSARDMKDNAEDVIALIKSLKCEIATGIADVQDAHPFIVIGESMGGVIGRYALTKMENEIPTGCLPNMRHNTRLFISLDAPQQGANVPMAAQELYKDVLGPLYYLPVNQRVRGTWIRNYLNSKGPRQLLAHHVSTNLPFSDDYFPHIDRTNFMNDLIVLDGGDGYPDNVKLFAISDGLLTGEHLISADNVNLIAPGDPYLDANATVMMRILGFPVVGVNGDVDLRVMPNQGNPFYTRNLGVNHWSVRINWRNVRIGPCPFCVTIRVPAGIALNLTNTTVSSYTARNGNMRTMDHMPGGVNSFAQGGLGEGINIGAQMNLMDFSVGPITVPGAPVPVTIPNFQLAGLDMNWNLSTRALDFNFIPVQSALDYFGAANRLDHDIFNENIAIKMARTPFDVIMGEYNGLAGYPAVGPRNLNHTRIRNNIDFNNPLANGRPLHLINREIGEEELWLDNWTVSNTMRPILQAEFQVVGGRRENRYYEYPGQLPTDVVYNHPNAINNGVFSQDRPLVLNSNTIIRNENPLIDNGIVNPWWINEEIVPLWVCDQEFRKIRKAVEGKELEQAIGLSVFPNPSQGEFNIELEGEFTNPTIEIINARGQVIKQLNMTNKRVTIGADLQLAKGMYLIRMVDANQELSLQKLIIQ